MYVPAHFEETRKEVLHDLIIKNPFAALITNGKSGLDANHVPFELNPHDGTLGILHSHVARANPVWQDLSNGDEVLVVFKSADAYISPQWYPSIQEHHKQVPTWNYMVAHARGRVTIHDDERYVRGLVARLTRTHEGSQPAPWKMGDSPADFIDTLLKAIVGIEIEITQLIGKSKLSQNKERRDLLGAGNALKASGQNVLGEAMLAAAESKN